MNSFEFESERVRTAEGLWFNRNTRWKLQSRQLLARKITEQAAVFRAVAFPPGEVPQRLLAYTWVGSDPDHLRWELRPHDDGCLLTLIHTFSERNSAADFGAA